MFEFENALCTLLIVAGIVSSFILVSLKAYAPIDSSFSESLIAVSFLQQLKTSLPMLVTVFGRSMLSRELQL